MYPKLTAEEFQAFLLKKKDFFDFYGMGQKVPLYRQVAAGLHQLSVCKTLGWYQSPRTHEIEERKKNLQEAITHYLKACLYNPEYLSYEKSREALGL